MSSDLAGALESRTNALNLVRLILAFGVIAVHSPQLTGLGVVPSLGGLGADTWCVGAFFCISGFLISRSRSTTRLPQFLLRRSARILPAYWLTLVVTAFGAAPAAAAIASQRFDPLDAAFYVVRNFLLLHTQPAVGETLMGNPRPHVWNGSLWSLWFEFMAYLFVAALVAAPVFRRWPLPIAAALHLLCVISAMVGPLRHIEWLGAFFTAGMIAWALGPRLVARTRWVCLALVILVIATWLDLALVVSELPLTYLLLVVGGLAPTSVASATDLSYGTYVFAFPVQQLLAAAGGARLGVVAFAVVSVAATLPLACASWFLVERPALTAARRWHPGLGRVTQTHPVPSPVPVRLSANLTHPHMPIAVQSSRRALLLEARDSSPLATGRGPGRPALVYVAFATT